MSTQQTDSQVRQAPLVSFIITYYQLPIKMLQECIESILALSLTDQEREIILIDDGSEKSPLSPMYDKHTKVSAWHEIQVSISPQEIISSLWMVMICY